VAVSPEPFAVPVVVVGALLVADLLLKAALARTAVPSVVVHLGLGFLLALAEWQWAWLDDGSRGVVDFLGSVGVVFLLFRVGLESNARKLLENLRGATLVWIADVTVSGALGFVVARHGLGFELVPSLFAAVSLTVTSVGVIRPARPSGEPRHGAAPGAAPVHRRRRGKGPGRRRRQPGRTSHP
jgi:Kef-type K+ transport system membrane component KefB